MTAHSDATGTVHRQERRGIPLALLVLVAAALSFGEAFAAGGVVWERMLAGIGFVLLLPQIYFRPVLWGIPVSLGVSRAAEPAGRDRLLAVCSLVALIFFVASLAARML